MSYEVPPEVAVAWRTVGFEPIKPATSNRGKVHPNRLQGIGELLVPQRFDLDQGLPSLEGWDTNRFPLAVLSRTLGENYGYFVSSTVRSLSSWAVQNEARTAVFAANATKRTKQRPHGEWILALYDDGPRRELANLPDLIRTGGDNEWLRDPKARSIGIVACDVADVLDGRLTIASGDGLQQFSRNPITDVRESTFSNIDPIAGTMVMASVPRIR
jgi:hypothetical protein